MVFWVLTGIILLALIIFLFGAGSKTHTNSLTAGVLTAATAEGVLVVAVALAAIVLPKLEVVESSSLEPIGGAYNSEFFLGSGRTPHGELELRYAVDQPVPAFEAVRATKSKIFITSEATPTVEVVSHVADHPWLSPFGGEVFTTYRFYLQETDILPGENLNLYIERN